MKDLQVAVKVENVQPIMAHIQDLAAVCEDIEKVMDAEEVTKEVKDVLESVLKLEQDLMLGLEAGEL